MASNKITMRIKGHEKFVLREGWLNKGILAIGVEEKTRIFLQPDAPETLGVGSNMVKSIRYWLKAFSLIDEKPGSGALLTQFAKYIQKYDSYTQDVFTLWLLHSHLVKNAGQATSWHLFFNNLEIEDYTKEQIDTLLYEELNKYAGISTTVNSNSVKDDVTVLLQMYCKEKTEDYDPEETNISPLSVLGLVVKSKNKYSKNQPDLSKLSEWVILYELAKIFEDSDSESVSIDSLYNGKNGIGNIYNLSRVALNDYLDKIANMSYIKVDRTAGLDMVYKQFDETANQVIEKYYEGH
ncbi:MAG: DUF4007 family protein [Lachnospiraceae bacterium]